MGEGSERGCLSKNSLARAVRISRRNVETNAARHAQLSLSSSNRQAGFEPTPSAASLPDGKNPQQGQARASGEPHSRQNRHGRTDPQRCRPPALERERTPEALVVAEATEGTASDQERGELIAHLPRALAGPRRRAIAPLCARRLGSRGIRG